MTDRRRAVVVGGVVAIAVAAATASLIGIAHVTTDPANVGTASAHGLLPAFPDAGDAADVHAAKAAVTALLGQQDAAGAITPDDLAAALELSADPTALDPDRARTLVDTPADVAARAAQLEDTFPPARAAELEGVYAAGLREALTSRNPDWLYTSDRWVVTSWQGVAVSDARIHALARGHMEWQLADSTTEVDPDLQYDVTLVPQEGTSTGWVISDVVARGASG